MSKKIRNQLGYHITFGDIRNSSNQVVATKCGLRIYTYDEEFINDLILPVDAMENHPKLNKLYVKYKIYEKDTKEKLAYLDYNNNIFNLNGDYIGSIRNYVSIITSACCLTLVAILSVFFGILGIRLSRGDVIDSQIVITSKETILTEEWQIFGVDDKEDMIYPGKTGEYIFSIENTNDVNVSIIFQLKDSNNLYTVPMVYKLSDANGYICGSENSWVDAEDLQIFHKVINSKNKKTYKLEWKWDGSNDDVDTLVGIHGGYYHLNIEIISTITGRKE